MIGKDTHIFGKPVSKLGFVLDSRGHIILKKQKGKIICGDFGEVHKAFSKNQLVLASYLFRLSELKGAYYKFRSLYHKYQDIKTLTFSGVSSVILFPDNSFINIGLSEEVVRFDADNQIKGINVLGVSDNYIDRFYPEYFPFIVDELKLRLALDKVTESLEERFHRYDSYKQNFNKVYRSGLQNELDKLKSNKRKDSVN